MQCHNLSRFSENNGTYALTYKRSFCDGASNTFLSSAIRPHFFLSTLHIELKHAPQEESSGYRLAVDMDHQGDGIPMPQVLQDQVRPFPFCV